MSHARRFAVRAAALATAASLAACGSRPASDPSVAPSHAPQASLFANGDFETGDLSGWTVTTNLNPGTSTTPFPPATLANLNLAAGGTNRSRAVTGATETVVPAGLTAASTLRIPRYGTRVAVVNELGASRNVNSLVQTMTASNADVDPGDGKVHVRFAIAPVLQNPGHADNQQPYFFVQLRNLTSGATLFQTFNFANQVGVPWKTDAGGVQYTDWKTFDIAPGPASLGVGDQVELRVVAAGCSQSGHWGHVYVDAFGPFLPGIAVTATAPQQVNSGADLTYTLSYVNSGPGTATNVLVQQPLPANTTFKSVSAPGATCTTPAVGATSGTVSCNVGTLGAAAGGAVQVTVTVTAAAGSAVSNGSYSIQADAVSPLLGPLVSTSVTSGVQFANVSASVVDGIAAVAWGGSLSYTVTIANAGPAAAPSATLSDPLPANVSAWTWTCSGAGGAVCPAASGSGSIAQTLSLPAGGSLTYAIAGTVASGSGSGTIRHVATVAAGAGVADPDTTNDVAVDVNSVGALVALDVQKGGTGTGRVVSVPAAIDCGAGCGSASASFLSGTTVALTASASAGHAFEGWSGACSGTANVCNVTVSGATAVAASFAAPSFAITATATPAVGGTLACPASVVQGQPAVCTVTPAAGWVLASLADGGVDVTASVSGGRYTIASVTAPHSLAATFAKANGTSCAGAAECASAACADGVCCDAACGGQCEACNLAGSVGTCTPATGAPVGSRSACATDGSLCGGACDGASRSACAYPAAATECRPGSCSGGTATLAASCDGAGACPAPQTQPCGSFACGVSACNGTCLSDDACAAGAWCQAGTCVPRMLPGAACGAATQCASGFCVDGVCCDTACAGQCEACDAAGAVGACSSASGPPRGSRPACASDGSACGGTCDGSSRAACAYPGASTGCRGPSCAGDTATLAATCAGTGSCPPPQTQACGAYACGPSACRGDCTADGECAAGNWCAGGVCAPKGANGTPCAGASQCASGFCADGVCCNAACGGQCEACDAAGSPGTCTPIAGAPHGARAPCASDGSACGGACDGSHMTACTYPIDTTVCRAASCTSGVATLEARCAGTGSCAAVQTRDCGAFTCGATACSGDCTADDQCAAGQWCSAGVCTPKGANGTPCGAAGQCASGFCVDGVCCNAACGGQCEACDAAGSAGTCSPVAGAPHGARTACASDATACGGTCDGTTRAACAYAGPETSCRGASCSGGVATLAATCTGTGICPPLQTQDCGAYACDATVCRGTCTADGECSAGSWCSGGICLPKQPNGGACGAASQCASAICVDGVCCNAACDGQCEACDVAGSVGTCTAAVGAPHGARAHCGTDGSVCGGACDGSSRVACAYPGAAATCRAASCAGGIETRAAACDGAGACPVREEASCAPYACGADACRTSCGGDADCTAGGSCAQGTCSAPGPGNGWHVQGSGCSTGGTSSVWPSLAALGLLGLLRRRRGRGALVVAAALALPAWGRAQETDRSFSTQRFLLAPGGDDILSVYSGRTAPPLAIAVTVAVDYADEPLRLVNGSQEVVLVRSQWNLQLGASIGLLSWLEVGLVVPATLSQSGDVAPMVGAPLASWSPSGGFGDPRLVPRVRLLDVAGLGVALVLPVSFPVGSIENYTGWDAVTFTPTAAVEYGGLPGLRVAGNVGVAIRPSRSLGDLTVGSALGYGVAGIYDFTIARQPFAAMVTLTGEVGISGSGELDPLELVAALRWNAPLGFNVTAGGGPGLSSGYGTPNYRFVASVGFAPWAVRATPSRKPEPAEAPSPAAPDPSPANPPAAPPAAAR
jgi:uncharacterized repeat protein (TIGR01451 family)